MIRDLIIKNRCYRRFHQEVQIDRKILEELVDLARLSSSPGNLQPLRYVLSCDEERNALIFKHLKWAAYLEDWQGPKEGERPSAYIIILGDRNLSPFVDWDLGIALQSIRLGAIEKGIGGCPIASMDKERLLEALSIPREYEILVVLALGRPNETVMIDKVGPDGDIRYWRDNQGIHHVPKRSLDDLIIG